MKKNIKPVTYKPEMVVNIYGSSTILEAWEWALEHELKFDFLAEGTLIDESLHTRIKEMLNSANFSNNNTLASALTSTSPDHDLDFLFYTEEDLLAFKLKWL